METSIQKSSSRTNLIDKNKSKFRYENENAAFIGDQQQRQQVVLFRNLQHKLIFDNYIASC